LVNGESRQARIAGGVRRSTALLRLGAGAAAGGVVGAEIGHFGGLM